MLTFARSGSKTGSQAWPKAEKPSGQNEGQTALRAASSPLSWSTGIQESPQMKSKFSLDHVEVVLLNLSQRKQRQDCSFHCAPVPDGLAGVRLLCLHEHLGQSPQLHLHERGNSRCPRRRNNPHCMPDCVLNSQASTSSCGLSCGLLEPF